MAYSNFEGPAKIPNITTRKSAPMTTNFAKGVSTYKPNDTMGLDELRLAQDARFDRVGEYGTRKGYAPMTTQAIGHAAFGSNWNESFSNIDASTANGFTFTASADATIYSAKVWIRKKNNNYFAPKVVLLADGQVISTATVWPGEITTSLSEKLVYFMDAPTVTAGQQIMVKVETQTGSTNDFWVGSADGSTLMTVVYSCTPGGITSLFEININGATNVLFVQNKKLYRLSSTNVIHELRTLPNGAGKVRFSQNLDKIRYTDGAEKPHILDPSNNFADSEIAVQDLETGTTLNVTMNNIMNGTADNLVYGVVNPDTEAIWTWPYGYSYAKAPAYSTTATIEGAVGTTLSVNINTISPSGIAVGDWITGQGTGTAKVTSISGSTVNLQIVDTTPQAINSYDKFSTKWYQNFPAIKTGDPLTAMFNLGGVLYFMTRRNKYQMYAQTAESWSQSACNAQGGTFSQESMVCDLNYAYYANDNGIYIFDGSSEASLTEKTIQNLYDSIPDKTSIVMDLYKNRLYCYYSDTAGQPNNKCLVYNINLRVWEAMDNNAFVSATSARQNSTNRFICGHSKIGMLMLNEAGKYADLSSPVAFNLETAYQHYGSTSELKRITKWRPEFAVTEKPYTCECGYALDFTDQVQYAFSIDLQKQIPTVLDYVWDNPSDYGVPIVPTVHTTIPRVNGEFYRCQVRYQHIAAFEPVIFRSHTLTVQTQRIR